MLTYPENEDSMFLNFYQMVATHTRMQSSHKLVPALNEYSKLCVTLKLMTLTMKLH